MHSIGELQAHEIVIGSFLKGRRCGKLYFGGAQGFNAFRLDLTDFAGELVTVSIHSDLGQLIWECRFPAVEELKL